MDMTLVGPFAHSSSNRQMGCCMSMGPKKVWGDFFFLNVKWSFQKLDAEGDGFSFSCQQNHCRYCDLRILRHDKKVACLWALLFSFCCTNSPKIHINITFPLGLNYLMNNKRKQQLPSMVPVKFLVLRDSDCFLPAFPPQCMKCG